MTTKKRRPTPDPRHLNRLPHARSLKLHKKQPLYEVAQCVLCDLFSQFITRLHTLGQSDDPETVHQARVAWRRFKAALRLFKPVLATDMQQPWQSLKALLKDLSALRDLDVARLETLPPQSEAYVAGDVRRHARWQSMMDKLAQAADQQRHAVRQALQSTAAVSALVSTTQWLEAIGNRAAGKDAREHGRHWLERRIRRLRDAMKKAARDDDSPQTLHHCRILAKQVRYNVEILRPLLPKKQVKHWCDESTQLQTRIGALRDVQQASALVGCLGVDPELVEFLRGVAARTAH